MAKRPGVDMFLFYMAHMYEIVVFSSMSQFVRFVSSHVFVSISISVSVSVCLHVFMLI